MTNVVLIMKGKGTGASASDTNGGGWYGEYQDSNGALLYSWDVIQGANGAPISTAASAAATDNGSGKVRITKGASFSASFVNALVYCDFAATYTDGRYQIIAVDPSGNYIDIELAYSADATVTTAKVGGALATHTALRPLLGNKVVALISNCVTYNTADATGTFATSDKGIMSIANVITGANVTERIANSLRIYGVSSVTGLRDYANKTILDGASKTIGLGYYTNSADGCVIVDNFTCQHFGFGGMHIWAPNCFVKNCYVYNVGGVSTLTDPTNFPYHGIRTGAYGVMEHCYIDTVVGGYGYLNTMYYSTVRGCVIKNAELGGNSTGTATTCAIHYSKCRFENNGAYQVRLIDGNLDNCIIKGNSAALVVVAYNSDQVGTRSYVSITNCVFDGLNKTNARVGILCDGSATTPPLRYVIMNNVFTRLGVGVKSVYNFGYGIVVNYNCFYDNTNNVDTNGYIIIDHTNPFNIYSDPKFVDYTNYFITKASPLYKTGTGSLNAATPRLSTNFYDLGISYSDVIAGSGGSNGLFFESGLFRS